MTIGSYGRRCRARRRRVHRRLACLIPAFVLASLITTTAAGRDPRNGDARPVAAGEVAAAADLPSYGAISNGTVRLGINPQGHIDVLVDGIDALGLQYVPTGADALIPGCWCEGWGVADLTSSTAGWASAAGDNGRVSPNLTVTGFDVTADTADSTVEIGGRLRVRHVYRPSPRPELYQVDLTVENVGGSSADVVYRRAMDWDVPPTEFDEFVTIQGSHPQLLDSTDNGFNHVNPLSPLLDLGARGTFKDVGPDDRGGVFDFALGTARARRKREPDDVLRRRGERGRRARCAGRRRRRPLLARAAEHAGRPDARGRRTRSCSGSRTVRSSSGPVIATGRLVVPMSGPPLDGDPTAVSGSVALYLPSTAASASAGHARRDGDDRSRTARFTLQTPLTPALAAAAVGQRRTDQPRPRRQRQRLGLPPGDHPLVRRAAHGSTRTGTRPPNSSLTPLNDGVNPRLIPGSPAVRRRAHWPTRFCTTYRFPIASARAWTTIGELHTPADTELASFTYGRKADSYISKAISLDGSCLESSKGSIKIGDEAGSAAHPAEVGISHGLDRWARRSRGVRLHEVPSRARGAVGL